MRANHPQCTKKFPQQRWLGNTNTTAWSWQNRLTDRPNSHRGEIALHLIHRKNPRRQRDVREFWRLFAIELTVVFEHADSRSWQPGPEDERRVIELIAQYQTALRIKRREEMLCSHFHRHSWAFWIGLMEKYVVNVHRALTGSALTPTFWTKNIWTQTLD